MNYMTLYNNIPVFAQNVACSIKGMRIQKKRYGKLFHETLEDFKSRNEWSYDQMCEYRDLQLKKIVKHCYETVPYYNKIFNDIGINYNDIKKLEDLKALPILTKQVVKDNFNDFISTKIPRKDMIVQSTSGSTGSGFRFYTTKEADACRWADAWRGNENIGLEFKTLCAHFSGNEIVSKDRISPPFYRINWPSQQILFSVYHINETNLKSYIEVLNKYKIKWIHGYPSSISLVAEYIIDHKVELSYKIEHVTLSSENVLEIHKQRIFDAFGVYPYQNYGQSECVAVFRERSDRKIFISEDIAAVEFIKNPYGDGYKIIGTTLTNYAMPFLRYDTNDLATVKVSDEGREIISIDGRSEDYIILKDGSKVGRIAHIFTDIVNIKESQIIQNEIGKIYIDIVQGFDYSKKDEEILKNRFKSRFGSKLELEIRYKNKIDRTKNGKLRFIISQL